MPTPKKGGLNKIASFVANNTDLYLYVSVIATGSCSWVGCGAALAYWEIGAWTDKLFNWNTWVPNYIGHYAFKPLINQWYYTGATWWMGPHDSIWPPGF